MKIFRFLIFALLIFSQSLTLSSGTTLTDDPIGLSGVPVVFGGGDSKGSVITESDDPSGLDGVPVVFGLHQNSPNPFNPVTTITYTLSKDLSFSFKVFNIIGQEVYSFNDSKPAGTYEIIFDGSNLSSGIYFYTLQANGFSQTRKMILAK